MYSRYSVECIVIRLHEQGSFPGSGKIFSSYPKCLDWLWGSVSFLVGGYGGTFVPVVNWPGHEGDRSLPSSADVKKD
jgi:hypothetical protein